MSFKELKFQVIFNSFCWEDREQVRKNIFSLKTKGLPFLADLLYKLRAILDSFKTFVAAFP